MKIGDVLAYKGDSIISKSVEFITNSPYSHVGIYVGNGLLIEADGVSGKVGFRNIDDYKGKLDIYTCEALTDEQRLKIFDYLLQEVGHRYDYVLLLVLFIKKIFGLRIKYRDTKNEICSELCNDAYKSIGFVLSKRKYPNPKQVVSSPLLHKIGEY